MIPQYIFHSIIMIMVTDPENDFEQPSVIREIVHPPLKIASLLFLLFGFYFLIFAMAQYIINTKESRYTLKLQCVERNCSTQSPSLIFADNSPVNIYLKTEVFQKDINIINSFSPTQFEGRSSESDDIEHCFGSLTNAQMNKQYNVYGQPLNQESVSFPCGQRVFLYPEGTIEMYSFKSQQNTKLTPFKTINPYSRNSPYSNYNLSLQWTDLTKPQFAAWMTELSSKDTSIYWGEINQSISGTYQISFLLSNDSHVGNYEVVLTDSMTFGGRNEELCLINFAQAIVCFVCAIVAYITNRKSTKVFDAQ